jgi:hypothetical protein
MKQLLSLILILGIGFIAILPGVLFASECKVTCKNGTCEIKHCRDNALCKCNWLGNPVCKCSKKGTIEEIGDVVDDILTPGK